MRKTSRFSGILGSILPLILFTTQSQATVIGNLSYESGAIVNDSLNDLEWFSFSDNRSKFSHSNLQALFDDSNSDLYGFSFAGIGEADLFLDAAFGAQTNNTAVSHNTYYSGIDATLFTSVMGDGYNLNSNNIWKYEISDTMATYNWTQDSRISGSVNSESASFNYDVFTSSMSWLAYRSVSVPEPSILSLFCAGLVGIGFTRRKSRM